MLLDNATNSEIPFPEQEDLFQIFGQGMFDCENTVIQPLLEWHYQTSAENSSAKSSASWLPIIVSTNPHCLFADTERIPQPPPKAI